jgi:hypothetical protein
MTTALLDRCRTPIIVAFCSSLSRSPSEVSPQLSCSHHHVDVWMYAALLDESSLLALTEAIARKIGHPLDMIGFQVLSSHKECVFFYHHKTTESRHSLSGDFLI